MDRDQLKIAEAHGYTFGFFKAGLTPQPKMNYYSLDKRTGEIIEHTLPADPYSMEHYLRKGFTLSKEALKPQVERPVVKRRKRKKIK